MNLDNFAWPALGMLVGGFLTTLWFTRKQPILWRVAWRNLWRRKSTVFFVLLGAMVGTAMIAASFAVGDSLRRSIRQTVYDKLAGVDTMLMVSGADQNASLFTPESIKAQLLPEEIGDYLREAAPDSTDAIVPALVAFMAAERQDAAGNTILASPDVTVIGAQIEAFADLVEGDAFPKLQGDQLAISRSLADALELKLGDRLMLHIWGEGYEGEVKVILPDSQLPSLNLQDQTVVVSIRNLHNVLNIFRRGEAALPNMMRQYLEEDSVFLEQLNDLGNVFEGLPDSPVNTVLISHTGDVLQGADNTDLALAELERGLSAFRQDWPDYAETMIDLQPVKREGIRTADLAGDGFTTLFVILSGFTIAAGVILIINIFNMLAEERKREIGLLRAIGLKQRQLALLFMNEGMVYAALASLLGTAAGVGASYLVLTQAVDFLQSLSFIPVSYQVSFDMRPASLVLSFALGGGITFGAIALASWRLSRLNIIRALRDTGEMTPPHQRRRGHLSTLLLGLLGVGLTLIGWSADPIQAESLTIGPPLLIAALMRLAAGRVSHRWRYSGAALLTAGYVLALQAYGPEEINQPGSFIITGLLLILCTVTLVVIHDRVFLRPLEWLLSRRRQWGAMAKMVVAYPLHHRLRSGMTMALFALVVFSVSIIAVMKQIQQNELNRQLDQQLQGYELRMRFDTPQPGLDLATTVNQDNELQPMIERVLAERELGVWLPDGEQTRLVRTVDTDYAEEVRFPELDQRAAGYPDDAAVWSALAAGEPVIVLHQRDLRREDDRLPEGLVLNDPQPGESLTVCAESDHERCQALTVAAVYSRGNHTDYLPLAVAESALGSSRYLMSTTYLLDVADQTDSAQATKALQKQFIRQGAEVINLEQMTREAVRLFELMLSLLEVYLGVGLVVGISGLGVIMVRTVQERRLQIAILRAIGFQRAHVLWSLLGETGLLATLGVSIGVGLGLTTSYLVFLQQVRTFNQQAEFVIPWLDIGVIVAVSLLGSLLAAVLSARKAAALNPADELRQPE